MKVFEIVLLCITAICTIILTYKWSELNSSKKILSIIAIITSVVVAFNSYKQTKKDEVVERINAKFGDIKDLHGSITIPKMAMGLKSTAIILLGGSGIFGLDLYSGPLMQLYIKDGKLFVSTIIRNLDGKIIAVIEDNTWTIFDDDFEYNDDNKTAFELVTKGERSVFFQIELKDGVAHISGYLLNDKGLGFIFYNLQDYSGAMYLIKEPETKHHMPSYINIPRIFKYPREKYYGDRQ